MKTRRGNRIYKIRPSARTYTFRKKVRGSVYYFNLGPDVDEAGKRADQIDAHLYLHGIKATLEVFQPDRSTEKKLHIPTVQEVIDKVFEAQRALGIGKRTFDTYKSSITTIVREGLGVPLEKARRQRVSVITPDLIAKYKLKMLDDAEEEDDVISRKRSCNTRIRNAKALFSEEKLEYFKGWDVSSVTGFLKPKLFKGVSVSYELPAESLIKGTHELLESLSGDEYAALALALFVGLRRKEIENVRRDWITILDDDEAKVTVPVHERNFRAKSAGPVIVCRERIEKILGEGTGFDYILGLKKPCATVKAMLDDIGWDEYGAPLHECRKLFTSINASTKGLYWAQKQARHKSPKTTNDHYADLVLSDGVKALWG